MVGLLCFHLSRGGEEISSAILCPEAHEKTHRKLYRHTNSITLKQTQTHIPTHTDTETKPSLVISTVDHS